MSIIKTDRMKAANMPAEAAARVKQALQSLAEQQPEY